MARRRNGYPLKIERSYYRDMSKLIREWQKIALRAVDVHLRHYLINGTKMLTDADNSRQPDWTNYVQQTLNLISINMENTVTDQILHDMTMRFVYAVSQFSANKTRTHQVAIQTKIGPYALNPLRDNAKLREYTWGKILENTQLIKTMQGRYIDQLKGDIYRNINAGGGLTDITHAISQRTGMALKHADLIATDQTGKILAQIDAYRNQQAGSTRYIWRSMEDKRVRPKHRELDGKEFKYDDPNGGDNGQLPGEPIRCRCYADPID